jgi:hypothetical protein
MTRYKNPTLAYFHCQATYTKKKKKKKKKKKRDSFWQRDRESKEIKKCILYLCALIEW